MILVVGSQRTGSTLMSMIIGAHPDTRLVGDADLPSVIDGKYQHNDVLHAVALTTRYDLIHEHYPACRYVFMLRDLKSVVASMLTRWAEKHAVAEISRSLLGLDWRKQHEVIAYLDRAYREYSLVKLASICAYLKSYYIECYLGHSLNVHQVRYEELVGDSREVIEGILSFLGLCWHDDVLSHHTLIDGREFAGNDPNRPIDDKSIDKWRMSLDQYDVDIICKTVSELDCIFDGFSMAYQILGV